MAVSSLESLLVNKRPNPDEILKCKIFVERLGEEIEVSFKRLSYTKWKYFKKAAIERRRSGDNLDVDKYRISVILDCLVDPDFQKKEFLDSFGAPNGEVGINRIPFETAYRETMTLLEQKTDYDIVIARYMFEKFGTLPEEVTELDDYQKGVIFAFLEDIVKVHNEQVRKQEREMRAARARRR